MSSLLLAHAAATLFMTGLIWFVQVVHYPLMKLVSPSAFVAYEAEHVRRTGWVVGPAMLLEAVTAAALVWLRPDALTVSGAVLLAGIWISTATVQVPLHGRLAGGYDAADLAALGRGNWMRTVGWSVRALLALALLLTQ